MRNYGIEGRTQAYFIGNASIDDLYTFGDTASLKRSLGGSALNACYQAFLLGIHSELHSAVGDDANGEFILEKIRATGMDHRGIIKMPGYSTLVYSQIVRNDSDDVVLEKSKNPATDAHTIDMLIDKMPGDLSNSLVYIAGSTRKPSFIDEVYKLENFLDHLSDRGATIAVDPGRTPDPNELRYHRAQTLLGHPNNLDRIDFLAMNESEFASYLNVSPEDRTAGIDQGTIGGLVEKYIREKAQPGLICITLGKNGLYLVNAAGSALVDVPPISKSERRTTVGLGDSTKAGMLAAILQETEGSMSPDLLAGLKPDQLRRIGAYGSAISAHRMVTETYGRPAEIAETIARWSDHYAAYGIHPDYITNQ